MQPKQIRNSNISNLTNGLLLPVPFTFPGIPSAMQGRGACDPVGFISHAQYPDPKLF